jgi:hypothetical protein
MRRITPLACGFAGAQVVSEEAPRDILPARMEHRG